MTGTHDVIPQGTCLYSSTVLDFKQDASSMTFIQGVMLDNKQDASSLRLGRHDICIFANSNK